MDEIRALIREALLTYDATDMPTDFCVEELLRDLKPYLKGPPIPIKKLNDLEGWVKLASAPKHH